MVKERYHYHDCDDCCPNIDNGNSRSKGSKKGECNQSVRGERAVREQGEEGESKGIGKVVTGPSSRQLLDCNRCPRSRSRHVDFVQCLNYC